MSAALTVPLSDQEAQALDALCRMTGRSRSEVVRESLRAQRLRESLRRAQEQLGPEPRAIGWLTEEDVLREVS